MSQHLSSLPQGLILINTEASLHLLGSEKRPCSRILFTPIWWPLFSLLTHFSAFSMCCPEELTSVLLLDLCFHYCVVCPHAWKTEILSASNE